MNNVISLDSRSLSKLVTVKKNNDVLNGLGRGKIGFLISAPEMGKGYCCLSIAYEIASGLPLLNLAASTAPLKVLYWPIEDGVHTVAKRITQHLKGMDAKTQTKIQQNMFLFSQTKPLTSVNSEDNCLQELAILSKDYDLLIIDTLREAIGELDEVDDDIRVKLALQNIAMSADIAVLAVHHVTKAVIRGEHAMNNASGSGFSRTLANARLQLCLQREVDKTSKVSTLTLSHLKANDLPVEDKIKDMPLMFTSHNVLAAKNGIPLAPTIKDDDVRNEQAKGQKSDAKSKKKGYLPTRTELKGEPRHITLDKSMFTDEANLLSEQAQDTGFLSKEDIEKYRLSKKKS